MSASAPEIAIKSALEAGLDALKTDPSVLDDLFASYDPTVLSAVKQFFANNTVTVRFNWPKPDIKLPAVCIILTGEQEDVQNDALGDLMGQETDNDAAPTQVYDINGLAETASVNLLVLTGDNELTVYLAHIVKRIVFLAKMALEQSGALINMRLSGSDIRMEMDYFPSFVYSRGITVSGLTYFLVKPPTPEWIAKTFNLTVTAKVTGT